MTRQAWSVAYTWVLDLTMHIFSYTVIGLFGLPQAFPIKYNNLTKQGFSSIMGLRVGPNAYTSHQGAVQYSGRLPDMLSGVPPLITCSHGGNFRSSPSPWRRAALLGPFSTWTPSCPPHLVTTEET